MSKFTSDMVVEKTDNVLVQTERILLTLATDLKSMHAVSTWERGWHAGLLARFANSAHLWLVKIPISAHLPHPPILKT